MQYRRFGDTYAVRIDFGEEITACLRELAGKENIRLGQVSAIGAADHAEIGVYDLEEKAYHREELNGFMEITCLAGNITVMDGEPYIHLHATLADQQHAVHGGHVIGMRVGATCEMFVKALDGEAGRQRDEKLGINLWQL